MSENLDIVIKGGSVELSFIDDHFAKGADPRTRKASDYKITQVVITGGGMDYKSEVFEKGSDCEIRIVCKR